VVKVGGVCVCVPCAYEFVCVCVSVYLCVSRPSRFIPEAVVLTAILKQTTAGKSHMVPISEEKCVFVCVLKRETG
jgi:hypothetical protein